MTSPGPQPRGDAEGGFLALMRHRNYALLWSGQLVSQLGDRFHWVAISLWVYAATGSALSVSYALMALVVAPAVVGLYAGALVDRLDRRRILIIADLVRAGLVAAIPWLMEHGIIWVYLDLFLVSAASAFFRPAMFAVIPQSVPQGRLLQANAFFASMDSSTEIIGPALAGLLVARFGYAAAMYIDAATYLISAVFVAGLRVAPPMPRPASGMGSDAARATDAGGVGYAIREGLRYVRGDRLQMSLLAFLVGGFWVAGLSSLQTPLAKGVLGITDQEFGWFQSIWGVGFIGASLLLGWFGRGIPKGKAIVLAYIFWAVSTGLMGLSPNYGVLVVTGFWVGFANMLLFVNLSTVVMEYTPADRLGRVITTRQVVLAVVRLVSLVGFGWLADIVGVRSAILAMAGLSLAGTAAAAALFPAAWRYGVQEPSRAPIAQPALTPTPAAVPPLPPARGLLFQYLEAKVDPEFSIPEQARLNAISIGIVLLGWLILLARRPVEAIGVALVVAATVAIAGWVRAWGERLKRSPGGQDGGGD